MNEVQYTISYLVPLRTQPPFYAFLFRTNWSDSHPESLEKTLLQSFPSPDYKVCKNTRPTTVTYETLN
jgi:hypothetical protein